MARNMMSFLGAVLAAYAGMLVLLLVMENRIIFLPSRHLWTSPAAIGVPHEDLTLTTSDGVAIHAWLLHAQAPRTGRTVLFFHGNAGNIADRLDNGVRLTELGLDVLLVEYRGYGQSEGSPSEAGVYRDADAAYDFLIGRGVAPRDLVVFGRSLGSGPAVDLASRRPCGALIIESALCSTRELARDLPVYALFAWCIPDRFRSLSKIRRVTCPIMVIHGTEDEIIPFDHGRRIHAAAPEPKRFHEIAGARHNDWYTADPPTYFAAWRSFLAR